MSIQLLSFKPDIRLHPKVTPLGYAIVTLDETVGWEEVGVIPETNHFLSVHFPRLTHHVRKDGSLFMFIHVKYWTQENRVIFDVPYTWGSIAGKPLDAHYRELIKLAPGVRQAITEVVCVEAL